MYSVVWLCFEIVMKKNTVRDRNWQMFMDQCSFVFFISYCISTSIFSGYKVYAIVYGLVYVKLGELHHNILRIICFVVT